MFNIAYRHRFQQRWLDELKLEYWRQVIRLMRLLGRAKNRLADWKARWLPFRDLLWLPLLFGIIGVGLGLVFTMVIPML